MQGLVNIASSNIPIPYEELISLCLKDNINIEYILTGKKEEKPINYKEETIKILENLKENDLENVYQFAKSKNTY